MDQSTIDKIKQTNREEILKFAGIMSEKEAGELQKIVAVIRKRARSRRLI